MAGCLVALLASAAVASASIVGGGDPDPWPYHTLQLGIVSGLGQTTTGSQAPVGFRYQYLAGGVNTGDPWEKWYGGSFVSSYIAESEAVKEVPVFTYYEIRQSDPGASISDEAEADLTNLANRATMLAYYENLKDFFEQAATAAGPVILQVEPDLWGYIEQHVQGNNAATVRVSVASSGMPDLRGMPNDAVGFAQAFLVLRNNYAPHVIVAYSDSIWGTGTNIQLNHPSSAQVAAMATDSVEFYRSLDARFNALFTETSDRDAGYAQVVDGAGRSWWWGSTDYQHLGEYIELVHQSLRLPVAIWQIPVGNTLYRVENNTPYHYQDNHVQFLLGSSDTARALLRSYAAAGVAALLFGSGQSTDTCACQDGHTPSTEPAPIDGNDLRSLNGDDDGGYFSAQALHYYRLGAIRFG